MATKRFVDANILLRYVLRDDSERYEEARQIIDESEANSLILTAVIVAEVVYILLKSDYSRRQVADTVLAIGAVASIDIEDRNAVEAAVELFGSRGLDFADCYILERSVSTAAGLVTQDRKLSKARLDRG